MHSYLAASAAAASPVLGWLLLLALIAAYWVPSFVAFQRHLPSRAQVVVVNLFLGWTVIGWVVALVMALRPVPPAEVSR
jgi:hypothetical protein